MIRAPSLLAVSSGPHRCWFCGTACGAEHLAADYVKPTNTIRQYVGAPSSDFVCNGCVLAHDERARITMHDGTVLDGKRMRGYSWLLTKDAAIAYSPSARWRLGDHLRAGVAGTWAMAVSLSGQKHCLYLTPVNEPSPRNAWTVALEEELVSATTAEFAALHQLATVLAAVAGRPFLQRVPTFQFHRLAIDAGREAEVEQWTRIWQSPLARLVSTLCPAKEDARGRIAD